MSRQDAELDRWEITTAALGLRGAYRRYTDTYGNLILNQAIAGVSVAEFVFWACALDERLRTTDPEYAARRDADERGRVLPALRFVRDRHTHQVAITTSLEFSVFRVGNRWRALDGITEPTDGREKKPLYVARRAAYEKYLAGRKPALALRDALDFLNREVAARGIEIEVHEPWG